VTTKWKGFEAERALESMVPLERSISASVVKGAVIDAI
jgi:hypothetical protein